MTLLPQTPSASSGSVLEIPAFLIAPKGQPRPQMTDKHREAVLRLTTAEALRVADRCRSKDHNFPPLDAKILVADGEGVAAKALLLAAVKHGNGQAELVMSVMRDPLSDPMTDSIAEKLTGKAIQRLPEAGRHAPRTTSRAEKKIRPSQTFHGDADTIHLVAEGNPRKAGTRAFLLYALYRPGMTVAEYVAAGGGRGNVKCDVERGNIRLEPAKGGAA